MTIMRILILIVIASSIVIIAFGRLTVGGNVALMFVCVMMILTLVLTITISNEHKCIKEQLKALKPC